MPPVVAIVGRPNVGKSTLANRIARGRVFLTRGDPGVTRDRNYVLVERYEKPFLLVDTGGLVPVSVKGLLAQVRRQAQVAIAEADLVLLVVDGKTGLHPHDGEVAELLRKADKRTILAVNKIDSPKEEAAVGEFYQLGFGDVLPVSAEHGPGVMALLERAMELLPVGPVERPGETIRVAVVGRPNVGKSSLVNRLLGQERVIVSKEPGTTRDSVDILLKRDGQCYLLVDTAGVRRPSKVKRELERDTVSRALGSIGRCDVALVMLDAIEGVTDQDLRLVRYANERGRGTVIAVNKWDLVGVVDPLPREYAARLSARFEPLTTAPFITISALTGLRVSRVLGLVDRVFAEYTRDISPARLSALLVQAVSSHSPGRHGGAPIKLFGIKQVKVRPPTFLIRTNFPQAIEESYQRHLVNRLRARFGFQGVPLKFIFRAARG